MKDLAFLLIIIAAAGYYTFKRKFEVVYSIFISGMVGVLLKYLVSSSMLFTNAPPAIQVMVFATLAVFNSFFWLVTAAFFVLGLDYPLAAVSGLLLGYGIGKWHRMRRKRILLQKGEVKRKVIHSAGGLVVAAAAFLLDKWIFLPILAVLAVFVFSLRWIKLPFINEIVDETQRSEEWKGRGLFFFLLGAMAPVYLGQPWILLVLAIGDGLSTLIGRFFGYTPLYRGKTVEGSLSGFIGAWAVAKHFYSPVIIPVALYVITELLAPIDDNFAVPVVLSLLYV